jgi:GxxExxY protein
MQGIPFDSQFQVPLSYKGRILRHVFIPDLVCFGKIIVELKAVSHLTDEHRAQIINYLKATGMELGLLVNFGHFPKIEIERFLNLKDRFVPERTSD